MSLHFGPTAQVDLKGLRRSSRQQQQILSRLNDKVLFALLEPSPLPEFWQRFHEPYVQLYGDSDRSETHRIDDLVVRLYWLIYRKTKSTEAMPNPSHKRTDVGK